jgi:hypothetical protein
MADSLQPWEEPGAVRRDCLPHRGPWLTLLVVAALLCAIALPPAGLALSILTRRLAKGDLARMAYGTMDPDGEARTRNVFQAGLGGVIIACVSMPIFLCLTLGLALELSR